MVQVWSIIGGATIPPKRVPAAKSPSVYTGLASSNAAAQCRIIGSFTGSGPGTGPAGSSGDPTRASSAARKSGASWSPIRLS